MSIGLCIPRDFKHPRGIYSVPNNIVVSDLEIKFDEYTCYRFTRLNLYLITILLFEKRITVEEDA